MWVRIALSLVVGARVFTAVCDRSSGDSARWGADTTIWARVALRSRGSVLVSLLCVIADTSFFFQKMFLALAVRTGVGGGWPPE